MKTHAVKEPITDNTLYVEVEPQPCNGIHNHSNGTFNHLSEDGKSWKWIKPPIAIGDTVYQGEEWGHDPLNILGNGLFTKTMWSASVDQPPQTMPIELAGKTFKVVGVEVNELQTKIPLPTFEEMKLMESTDKSPIYKKWFWSYKLEEIK